MTRRTACVAALVALCGLAAPSLAVQPDEILPDRQLEQRARTISEELRCLVCQNQSIDDSDAPLARDLRTLVRDRLRAGDDDAAVRRFIVSRYGEFVLLKPAMAPHTLLLWLGPGLVLLAGLAGLAWSRRKAPAAASLRLSDAEKERLAAVLRADG